MKISVIPFFLLLSVIIFSCQRELSFETINTPSAGSLQEDGTGACLGSSVSGAYIADTVLTEANYAEVNVNVTTPGTYTIYTDTVNGYSFKRTGSFTAAGLTTVKLKGSGTPLTTGINNFTVYYDSTQCSFSVTVISGGSGNGAAVFSLDGAPGGCTNAVIGGAYQAGTALTAANTVTIQVNVATTGTYAITTNTVNGFAFSAIGSFSTTGPQTVVLTCSGLPAAAGNFTYILTAGTSVCSFKLICDPSTQVTDYFPRTANSNWSYEYDGSQVDSEYVKVITPTVPAGGNTYNVFMYTNDAASGYDTSGYYRKAANDYFQWMDVGYFWGLDNPLWAEYTFLKDNQSAGFTWTSQSFTGNYTDSSNNTFSVTVRMKYKIIQKDVNYTVTSSSGTLSFPNTIEVEEGYEQFDGTNWVDLGAGTTHYFYSRNIGLVDTKYFDAGGTSQDNYSVRRYEVF